MVHKKYIRKGGKKFGPYLYENYRENGITKTRYLGKAKNTNNFFIIPIIFIFFILFCSSLLIFKDQLPRISSSIKDISGSIKSITGFATEGGLEEETIIDLPEEENTPIVPDESPDETIPGTEEIEDLEETPTEIIENETIQSEDDIGEENSTEILVNETEETIPETNITETQNLTDENITIFGNETDETLSETINQTTENQNLTDENETEETPEMDITTNISIDQTEINVTLNHTITNQTEINLTNGTIIGIQNLTEENVSIQTIQYQAVLGKPVKWKKEFIPNEIGNLTIILPKEAENITVNEENFNSFTITGGMIGANGNFLTRFFENIFRFLTGRVVDEAEKDEGIQVEINVDKITEYEIEYETPAPTASETETEHGKNITITGPDSVHYENILSFTNLSKEKSKYRIKIYRTTGGIKELTNITNYIDSDDDGLIEQIEWIVPHLSEETYELIEEKFSVAYKNKNMTAEFKDGLDTIGETILKSHKTYDEVLKITSGKNRTVIWYEFSNFKDIQLDAFGEVEFIDMREKIANESLLKEGGFIEGDNIEIPNPNYLLPINKTYRLVYLNEKGEWIDYNSKEIPQEKITLGVQVDNLAWGEFLDVRFNILENKLDRHALVEGTNCGFVTVAPTTDPAGSATLIDGRGDVSKYTSPATATKITEIGWWSDQISEESNFEVALYAADGAVVPGEAGTRLYVDDVNAKGTTAGWKRVTGLNWAITPSTDYWLAVQVDDTVTGTTIDFVDSGMHGFDLIGLTSLPNPFGGGALTDVDYGDAIYAVYETAPPDINFTDPTPSDGSSTDNKSIIINVSISDADLDEVNFNWNGTNYSMYDDSLVLMMNFDNRSELGENDTYVADLSGYGSNGTVTGAVVNTTDCKYGNCLNFDTATDYLSFTDSDIWTWTPVSEDRTFSFWFYPTTNPTNGGNPFQFIVTVDSSGNRYQAFYYQTGGNLYLLFSVTDNAWTTIGYFLTPYTLNLNTWNHVTFVASSSGNNQIFVNAMNKSITESSWDDNTLINPTLVDIKSSSGSSTGTGMMDEFRIWNRSLSSDEIYETYVSNLQKFNQTQWYLYVNQSKNATDLLDDGTYTYFASAKDIVGNENRTETRTITIGTAGDTTPPDILITSPENNSNSSDVHLDINYTVSGTPESCWYSNDTYSANVSLANCGTNITDVVWTEGQHNVTVWANDSSNNQNYSRVSFNIDSTVPYFTTIPANTSINYTQGFGVDFEATDETSFGTYAINWTTLFQINSSGWLENSTPNIAVGNYYINITINDTLNNVNSTIYQVTINKADPSTNMQITGTTPIEYPTTSDFSESETNAGDGGCSYSIDKSNGIYGVGTWTFNYSTTGCDNYTAGSITKDLVVNQNTSLILGLTGTTPIEYPATTDFTGSGCPAELSCSLNISNAIYGAGDISANYSTAGNENYSATSTIFTITINQNSTYVLGISGTSPIIYGTLTDVVGSGCPTELSCSLDKVNAIYGVGTETFNYSTAGNTNYSANSITIDITINQATPTLIYYINSQLNNISIVYPQEVNASAYTDAGTIFIYRNDTDVTAENGLNVSLAVGNYTYIFNVTGNTNYTDVSSKTITINVTKAILSGNLINNTALTLEYPNPFNFSFSETNIGDGDVTYSVFRNGIDVTNENNSVIILGVGSYDFILNSTGGVNYTENSSIENFTVTITQNSSYVLGLAITPSTTETYPTEITATGSGCPAGLTCNLTLNLTGIVDNPHVITIGAGVYNYTYNNSGNTNYSAKEISEILTINQNTSAVIYTYLNNSRSNVTIYNNTAILLNATLFNVSGTISLYNNGTLINTGTDAISNLTDFNATGMYNITGIYLGDVNYSGSSETWWINVTISVIDTTAPDVIIVSPTDGTTYTTSAISFEATTNENSLCNYSLDAGVTNTSLTANSTGTGHTASATLSNANYVSNFYCSDLLNNQNNTENVSFIVNVVSVVVSPGGGGGGGGGGVTVTPKIEFTTSYDSYGKTISLDSIEFEELTIKNTGKFEREYTIEVQTIGDIILFDETKLTISPGDSETIDFKIFPPKEPGVYTGKVIVSDGDQSKEILFNINIRTEKNLFDVSLLIPKSMKTINTGDVLTSQINLVEMGIKENIDVTIHYLIKDFSGRIYLDESETFAVYDQKSFTKEFSTETLAMGDYVLGIELIYPDGVAVASSQFKVQEKILGTSINKWIVFAISFAILLILGMIILTIRRYKSMTRKLRRKK